jgi:hypothetical protein
VRPFLSALGLLALSANFMVADLIPTTGSWIKFQFQDVGSFAEVATYSPPTFNPVADQTLAPPWTFSGPAALSVLDLWGSGDRFRVFDNSVELGVTSLPVTGVQCLGDIGCALADPTHFSFGAFELGAGNHAITIQVMASPNGPGGAVLSAQSAAVPEPGSLILLMTGIAALGLAVRIKGTN